MKYRVDERINSWTFENFHAKRPIFLREDSISIIRRLFVSARRSRKPVGISS